VTKNSQVSTTTLINRVIGDGVSENQLAFFDEPAGVVRQEHRRRENGEGNSTELCKTKISGWHTRFD